MAGYPSAVQGFIEEENSKLAEMDVQLPFERQEYTDRLQRLRRAMADAKIDILILTSPDSMCWLHGFTCRWYEWGTSTKFTANRSTVVHVADDPMFFIDTSYHAALIRHTSCVEDFRPVPLTTGMDHYAGPQEYLRFLIEQLRAQDWPGNVVGVERFTGIPTPAVAEMQNDALRDAGYTIVDATVPIREVRRRKSDVEMAKIEQAAVACDAGLRALQRDVHAGMTELEAWSIFMSNMVAAGGEPSAIHETVYCGPPEAFAHGLSTRRVIGEGAYGFFDMSAAVNCYQVRCTRPFFVGDSPPPELVELARILAGAYDVVRRVGKVGTTFGELSLALSQYLEDSGIEGGLGFAGGYELGVSLPPDYVGEFVWGTDDVTSEDVIEPGIVTDFESVGFSCLVDTVVFEETGPRFLSELPHAVMLVEP